MSNASLARDKHLAWRKKVVEPSCTMMGR